MEIFEFDVQKCLDAKGLLRGNNTLGNIYKKNCSYPHFLGNCTDLYYLLMPTDYLDFYEKELRYAENNQHLPIIRRGLTYREFYDLAVKFKTLAEEATSLRYDLSAYFYALVCHAIIETFNGQKVEELVMSLLKRRGYDVQKVNGDKDANYGLDIAVNGITREFYIQVKPITFFFGNKEHIHRDRIGLCRKRENILEMEKIDTYYLIYENNGHIDDLKLVSKDNGKILFKINDLFDYDKNDIENTIVRHRLPKNRVPFPF
jgi:hypothetical protein